MVNFFSNFASVVASIVGITFAFLISKVLNNEKEQKDVLSLIEKKIVELKKIKREIEIVGINNAFCDSKKKSLLKEYKEEIKVANVNDKSFFIDYGCFYLDLEEMLEEFKSIKIKVLEENKNQNLDMINLRETYEKIVDASESSMKISDIFNERERESKKLLLELETCKLSLEKNGKELEGMKNDEIKLKVYLIFILIFFLLGIVYPLSYTKYNDDILKSNNEVLNYSLSTNFLTELFSMSGLFLSILTIFIGIILWYIWKETAIRQKSEEIINKIKRAQEDVKSNWIIKRYYEFEELKKDN